MPPLEFFVSQWSPLPNQPTGPILAGKIVLLTGANSGVGLAAAHQLAEQRPEHLILACRNVKTGAEALDSILKANPGVKASMWELDLADFDSVKAFAARANKELPRIDTALLNAGMNVGMAAVPMTRTKNGHEITQQVNVLATILLALLLVPALRKSADPHMEITSSEVHGWANSAPIEAAAKRGGSIIQAMDDESIFVTKDRYFQSKLLLQMVVRYLIPAVPDIVIVAANPGMCMTNLGRDMGTPTMAELWDMLPFIASFPWMRGAGRGAKIITSASRADKSCEYWHVGVPAAVTSVFMCTLPGMDATKQYYDEVVQLCEKVAPGCTVVLSDLK